MFHCYIVSFRSFFANLSSSGTSGGIGRLIIQIVRHLNKNSSYTHSELTGIPGWRRLNNTKRGQTREGVGKRSWYRRGCVLTVGRGGRPLGCSCDGANSFNFKINHWESDKSISKSSLIEALCLSLMDTSGESVFTRPDLVQLGLPFDHYSMESSRSPIAQLIPLEPWVFGDVSDPSLSAFWELSALPVYYLGKPGQ